MPVGLLGRKIGMTQVYDDSGVMVPVTVLELGPCTVLSVESGLYEAVQLGFGDRDRRRVSRADRGQVADIGGARSKRRAAAGVEVVRPNCEPKKFVREFRVDGEGVELAVGDELRVSHFAEVAKVDVIATSKGRGFAGVMKRHNFAGQRASHGVKRVHRHGGSIGQSADPARVLRGTKMPGRYGGTQITVRNLTVVRIDEDQNLMLVGGAVPGPNGGSVVVRQTNKMKRPKGG